MNWWLIYDDILTFVYIHPGLHFIILFVPFNLLGAPSFHRRTTDLGPAPWCVRIPSINFGVNNSGEKHSHYKKGMVLPYKTVGFNHLSGIFHLYRHFHISSYWKIRVETKENLAGKTCLRLRNFTECYWIYVSPLKCPLMYPWFASTRNFTLQQFYKKKSELHIINPKKNEQTNLLHL